ncbi:ArnT family glycosyltransferase [Maribacter sp. 2-571]|uniref:ArnT family glycosyltransferase n=1 Tax=Maribacter sp. 2-571 TaxID=3417569 RepID=UPI003D328270
MLITRSKETFSNLGTTTVFGLLLLVASFIRFPFFFRDYIDRDESTFILMGQSWADGNLPYTQLWDLKPPLTFLFFAGIIYAFGKSFFAIRFFGTIAVAITAFFTYKITGTTASKKTAFWAAIGAVALQSLFGSIQGVMSEHLCMAFFVPGLYILIVGKRAWSFLGAGILMGIAIMIKLNIAYAVLPVSLYYCYVLFKKGPIRKSILLIGAYGSGILLVVLGTLLPYLWNDIGAVWWNSVVLAALEYAGSDRDTLLKLAPTFLILIFFFGFAWKKGLLDFNHKTVQLLSLAIFGVLFSFAKVGRINSHYLIQLHPLLVILVAVCWQKGVSLKNKKWKKLLLVLLLCLPAESYLEYYRIAHHKITKGTFYNGEGIAVPTYIRQHFPKEKNILFLGYHIGYWPLDVLPPTKAATHPSNICRSMIFPYFENPRKTGLEELNHIMNEIRPQIIVTRTGRLKFDKSLILENEYIDDYIEKHYAPIKEVEKATIYKRLEGL